MGTVIMKAMARKTAIKNNFRQSLLITSQPQNDDSDSDLDKNL